MNLSWNDHYNTGCSPHLMVHGVGNRILDYKGIRIVLFSMNGGPYSIVRMRFWYYRREPYNNVLTYSFSKL